VLLRNLRFSKEKIGLFQYNTDNYLFGKYKNNKFCLQLYVDDILIAGENKEIVIIDSTIKHNYKVSTDKRANKTIKLL